MPLHIKTAVVVFLVLPSLITVSSFTGVENNAGKVQPVTVTNIQPKIQTAILLDVSNSMDGLIEQAKAQLWNMVTVMGKAKCENDITPQLEIALYEYGRSTNDAKEGYVKKINGFISDLDSLSQNLFSLTTQGGDEYCGQVIYTSMNELTWDANPSSYRVIFIAGNEDFLQGNLHYTKACAEAKKKGVIVNSIYCGSRADGIREHWNLGAECGSGSFTNINQDVKIEDIPTPYDSMLFSLNEKMNNTYIAYGYDGLAKQVRQGEVDKLNYASNKSAAIKRVTVKSSKGLYKNESWDLVDARDVNGDGVFDKIDKKDLPDSLKNKTREELKAIVSQKSTERSNVQREIARLNTQRDAYITAERVKNAANKNNAATLETEVEKIIKEQAKRVNMKIE